MLHPLCATIICNKTTVRCSSFTRPLGCEFVSPTVLDASGAAVQARAPTPHAAHDTADAQSQAQIGVNDTLLAMMFECTVSCPQLYTESKYTDSLHFIAQVPAGGYATFTLSFDPLRNSSTTHYPVISPVSQTSSITNGHVTLDFSPDTGLLTRATTSGGSEFAVRQNYWSYIDPQGGAYCLVEQQAAVQLSKVRAHAPVACRSLLCSLSRLMSSSMRCCSSRCAAYARHCRRRPRHVSNVANVGLWQRPAPALQAVPRIPCRRGVSRVGHPALEQGAAVQDINRPPHKFAPVHGFNRVL